MFKLGGGIQGFQPKLLGGGAGTTGGSGMDGASTRGLARKVLRTGFGRFGKKDWSEGFRLELEGRPENGEYFRVDESDPLVEALLQAAAALPGTGKPPPNTAFYKSGKFLALHGQRHRLGFFQHAQIPFTLLISELGTSDIFNTSFENLVKLMVKSDLIIVQNEHTIKKSYD